MKTKTKTIKIGVAFPDNMLILKINPQTKQVYPKWKQHRLVGLTYTSMILDDFVSVEV
jgi:hypothetical protein